jgi:hypothetical protein
MLDCVEKIQKVRQSAAWIAWRLVKQIVQNLYAKIDKRASKRNC